MKPQQELMTDRWEFLTPNCLRITATQVVSDKSVQCPGKGTGQLNKLKPRTRKRLNDKARTLQCRNPSYLVPRTLARTARVFDVVAEMSSVHPFGRDEKCNSWFDPSKA
eukprot:464062-Pleurochrysis_carterae.AAC.4